MLLKTVVPFKEKVEVLVAAMAVTLFRLIKLLVSRSSTTPAVKFTLAVAVVVTAVVADQVVPVVPVVQVVKAKLLQLSLDITLLQTSLTLQTATTVVI